MPGEVTSVDALAVDPPEQGLLHAGPATGLPLVVRAGHSAFLSFDGPVQVIGPNAACVTPVVQPKLVPWSEVM